LKSVPSWNLTPALELDRVDQAVLAHVVALGQHGNELHVLVEAEQALVERLGHGLRQRVVGVVGIGGGERRRDGEHDVLGGVGRRGHRGNARAIASGR
jgi:hypothetical protein